MVNSSKSGERYFSLKNEQSPAFVRSLVNTGDKLIVEATMDKSRACGLGPNLHE